MSITYNPDRIDVLDTEGVFAALTVTTTPVEAKVGANPLTARQVLVLQPKDRDIFYGFSNTVTASTGIELFRDQTISLPVGPSVRVWLVASSGSRNIRIQEIA
jgi:hypothetical protein